jgi:hypothetical protein
MVAPTFGSVLIGPLKKVLIGAAVTSEIRKYAIETAVQVVEQALTNAATITIDSAMLDAAASDTTRPGGLLHNVTAITATSSGGLAALVGDLGKIADAMATAKIPAENLVFITSSAAAIRMRAVLPPGFPYVIIGSIAVAATTLIGIAPSAVALFVGPPEIESGDAPVVILDTQPRDNLDTTTVATQTVRAAYQCDLIVLKCRIRAAWGPLVTSGAVQLITSISW